MDHRVVVPQIGVEDRRRDGATGAKLGTEVNVCFDVVVALNGAALEFLGEKSKKCQGRLSQCLLLGMS